MEIFDLDTPANILGKYLISLKDTSLKKKRHTVCKLLHHLYCAPLLHLSLHFLLCSFLCLISLEDTFLKRRRHTVRKRKPGLPNTDEFSEKFRMALDPPPLPLSLKRKYIADFWDTLTFVVLALFHGQIWPR